MLFDQNETNTKFHPKFQVGPDAVMLMFSAKPLWWAASMLSPAMSPSSTGTVSSGFSGRLKPYSTKSFCGAGFKPQT